MAVRRTWLQIHHRSWGSDAGAVSAAGSGLQTPAAPAFISPSMVSSSAGAQTRGLWCTHGNSARRTMSGMGFSLILVHASSTRAGAPSCPITCGASALPGAGQPASTVGVSPRTLQQVSAKRSRWGKRPRGPATSTQAQPSAKLVSEGGRSARRAEKAWASVDRLGHLHTVTVMMMHGEVLCDP